ARPRARSRRPVLRRAAKPRSTNGRFADRERASRGGSVMGPHIASICVIPSTLTAHREKPFRTHRFQAHVSPACCGLIRLPDKQHLCDSSSGLGTETKTTIEVDDGQGK